MVVLITRNPGTDVCTGIWRTNLAKVYREPKLKLDHATGKLRPVKDQSGKLVLNVRWKAFITDHKGKRKKYTFTTSRTISQKHADLIAAREYEIKHGLRPEPAQAIQEAPAAPVGPTKAVVAALAYDEAAARYLEWGKAHGGKNKRPWSQGHAVRREYYLGWWKERLNLVAITDLNNRLADAETALQDLAATGKTGKTLNHYREALKSFTSWCLKRKYLAEHPFTELDGFNGTPVRVRRDMTDEEIWRLLGVCPLAHRLLYETAFATGFRAGELRSLTPDHLDRAAGVIKLDADDDKGRKERRQPVSDDLLARLEEYGRSGEAKRLYDAQRAKGHRRTTLGTPDNPLLYVPVNTAAMIKADLKAAGIPIATKDGVLDFHACRVAYINMVIKSGADVKTAQELARHSTPMMTMQVYARANNERLSEVAETVGKRIAGDKPKAEDIGSK
jgi:integrase